MILTLAMMMMKINKKQNNTIKQFITNIYYFKINYKFIIHKNNAIKKYICIIYNGRSKKK